MPILNIEQYDKYKVEHNNKSLLDDSVSFEWDDIKYIIVKNQANIKEYKQLLKNLGCSNDNIYIYSTSNKFAKILLV